MPGMVRHLASRAPCRALWRAAVSAILGVALSAGTLRAVDAGTLIANGAATLGRIAFAVDGAESSHGADPNMWRPAPDGPQGPMQVSAAAAADVGGGDRFDLFENRLLGRAYLAHLYRRYENWADAVAAYNWGPGNMDAWIGAGRPIDRFPLSVSLYRFRVLFGAAASSGMRRLGIVRAPPRRPLADLRHPSRDSVAVERLYNALMAATANVAR